MAEATSCPRDALSQLSQSNLNCRALSSKKRKFVEDVVRDPFLEPFTATLFPDSNSKHTHTLVPISRLNRSRLRLSYLDFGPGQASLPSGRPFHADIAIFNEHHPEQESKLLLARLAPNGGLYIIEEAGSGVFVACRLRSWVKEDYFAADVTGDIDRGLLDRLCGYENQSTADDAYPIPKGGLAGPCMTVIPSPKRPKNRKGVLARMSIIPQMELGKPPTIQHEHEPELERHLPVIQSQARGNLSVNAASSPCLAENGSRPDVREAQHQLADARETERSETGPGPFRSANDAFASNREILLQTLYTSQSTLAYFTKSTLARTRATVRSSTTASTSDLADFYRSRLITSKKMDLKYRDTIPKIIENAILQASLDEGEAKPLANCTQKKPSRRKKLGKDGLYAGEESFIRTWWLNRDGGKNEISSVHSRGQEMQALLTDLRNRETQLQIILILEIMTLESRKEVDTEGMLPPAALKQEPDDDQSNCILAGTPLKINKRQDLRPDLDILVDRMCIYHSVSIIDSTTSDEAKRRSGETGNEVGDKLRDFCCTVILPFYRHKAPELVKEISRKLGGPDLSPKRPIISSRTTSSSRAKPGATTDPRRRSIPRRTLERVLSEEQSSRQSSPPVLMRSATAPLGSGCSRVSVETVQRPSSRGSLQKSRSFTSREVDLVASSKAHTAKRKKLANLAKQKEELDAAIHALKKPNRGLVGMEIMAGIEKRRAEQDTSRRSTLGRSWSGQALDLQIAATPKKGAILGNAKRKGSDLTWDVTTQLEDAANLPPEEPAIPSSAVRNVDSGQSQLVSKTSDAFAAKRGIHPGVSETPSRGSCKTSNPLSLPMSIHTLQHPDSPARPYLPPNLTLIQATPSTNRLRPDHASLARIESTPLRMTKSQRPVLFTPLKKAEVSVEGVFRDAPLVSEKTGKAMERAMNGGGGGGMEASIYDSLGWDDDDDDDVDELL